jgi:hypothetical protein
MNADIFLEDFEITENTELNHAILGRCIVAATRFDNLCAHTALYLDLKYLPLSTTSTDQEFKEHVERLFEKLSNLNENIKSLPAGEAEKDILHNARKARNEIAHSLSIGLTGCLDSKLDESLFTSNVSSLIRRVAAGDFLISTILSYLNKQPLPQYIENTYKQKLVNWVLGK